LWSPLKIAANLFGLTLVVGLVVVKFRVRHDPYEDNGLTKGQDFLFIDLLIAVLVTGFLTEATRYLAWGQWVLPVYVTHLAFVAALLLTAPFSRLSHVFVVPALVGVRRITEEIVKSGINPQFAAEPSPGRHHKGRRIVNDLVKQIYPGEDVPALRIRYYP
jgi:nitrate reductase gamma subunit